MLVVNDSYAVVTDGNVRLIVFPPAVDNGYITALMWSKVNTAKELVAPDIDGLLRCPFDLEEEASEITTLPLGRLFPPAVQLLDWIPQNTNGWLNVGDNGHFLRVSPQMTNAKCDSGSAEHWFVLYNDRDKTVHHKPASEFWDWPGVEENEVVAATSLASLEYQELVSTLTEAERSV